jgi:2'-5' RNA ligase
LDLHQCLTEVTRAFGFVEDKPWHAHVTIGRVTNGPLAPLPTPDIMPTTFDVDRFLLMRSMLSSNGSEYELVQEFPL